MKCRGKPDTTWTILRSITLSPLHFMLYRGPLGHGTKTRQIILHPLQSWEDQFVCGDLDYFWDSADRTSHLSRFSPTQDLPPWPGMIKFTSLVTCVTWAWFYSGSVLPRTCLPCLVCCRPPHLSNFPCFYPGSVLPRTCLLGLECCRPSHLVLPVLSSSPGSRSSS